MGVVAPKTLGLLVSARGGGGGDGPESLAAISYAGNVWRDVPDATAGDAWLLGLVFVAIARTTGIWIPPG